MFKFDATNLTPSGDTNFDEPVQKGLYGVIVKEAVMTDTKAGDGSYINVRADITHGEHKGRVIWHKMTYTNPNSLAQEIGRQQLTDLCHATGKLVPKSTEELCNIPVIAKVGFVPEQNGYPATNDIKAFMKFNEAKLPKPSGTPFTKDVKDDVPPWQK